MGRAVFCTWGMQIGYSLTSKSVQGSALPLQGIDDINGGDRLPLGMLGEGDGITDDVLRENLQKTTGLFIDEARDAFHSTSTDSGLGNTPDVITKYFWMTLSASFSQSFSSLSTSRHVYQSVERLPGNNWRHRPFVTAPQLPVE